eukprot:Opistho-2@89278
MLVAVGRAVNGAAKNAAVARALLPRRFPVGSTACFLDARRHFTPLNQKPFDNLVRMQQSSCGKWPAKDLFGVKTATGDFKWTSYGEFAQQVDHFRGALSGLGVKPGDKVAVISNNRLEWAIGAYATYSLGAHYVPMYSALI